MLVSLYAENVALIKKLNIEVGAGFTVLTGETGGGKSIIVDSMALLCGARGDKTLIRTGEDQATVEGVFDVSGERAGDFAEFAGEDGLMSVYRRITADGRSVCRINGRTVPVNRLRELVSRLLNIHGQQDTQSLSDPQTHIVLLDTYAGDSAELASYREQYEVYTAAYAEAERMRKLAEEKMLRLDVLDYQINELENASVRAGEESELEGERSVLVNYEKIYDNVRGALEELKGRDSALSKIGRANDSLRRIENVLAGSSDYIKRLESCVYEIEDVAESLKEGIDLECESPEKRIDEIEERLSVISRLKRKYRTDDAGLAEQLETFKREKKELDMSDEYLADKRAFLAEAEKELARRADVLRAKRQSAAALLEKEIEECLASLDMPSVTFKTEFTDIPFCENGSCGVEFLISANKGELPRPIARIASGGELSRIMLAIKSAFVRSDGVGTVVFDEIDSGISGKTSEMLGKKLKELAQKGIQIMCITHSAQVASQADTHWLVSKGVEGERTYTHVKVLGKEERIDELARIMGGIKVTDAVRSAARETLDSSHIPSDGK